METIVKQYYDRVRAIVESHLPEEEMKEFPFSPFVIATGQVIYPSGPCGVIHFVPQGFNVFQCNVNLINKG